MATRKVFYPNGFVLVWELRGYGWDFVGRYNRRTGESTIQTRVRVGDT